MMSPQSQLALLYLAVGLLEMALAIPLIRRMVPRNGWYGVRVPKTLASDAVWYPVNRFFGMDFLRCGEILALGALLLFVSHGKAGLTLDQVAYAGLLLTLLPLIVSMVRMFVYLRRF